MEIKLSKRQKAILIGNILGDGHLEFNGHYGILALDILMN